MESAIAQDVTSSPLNGTFSASPEDWFPSPDEIHEAMAILIATEDWPAANEMAALAQVLHPSSEKVLILCALLAEVQQHWETAFELLRRLEALQGDSAPLHTFYHQVRVLRCLGDTESALQLARDCRVRFPAAQEFLHEIEGLETLIRSDSEPSISFHPI